MVKENIIGASEDAEVSNKPAVFSVDRARLKKVLIFRAMFPLVIGGVIFLPHFCRFSTTEDYAYWPLNAAIFGACFFLIILIVLILTVHRIKTRAPEMITLFNDRMALGAREFYKEFYYSRVNRVKLTPPSYATKAGGYAGTPFTMKMTVISGAAKDVFILDAGMIGTNAKRAFDGYERFFHELKEQLANESGKFLADLR